MMRADWHKILSAKPDNNPFAQTTIRTTEAGHDKVDKSWHKFVTFFPYYRMYFVHSGQARLLLQNTELLLTPGYIYFVPAFSVIDADCEEILEHAWVHFELDITTANYLSILKPTYKTAALPSDEAAFSELIETFNSSHPAQSPSALLKTDGICRYLLSRFLPNKTVLDDLNESARFLPVLQYIDEHISEQISNRDLARLMYLSTTYFANLFTKQFGIAPRQYVLNKRMSAAAKAILENKQTVKEIAFSLGFENESYFNRLFRKFTGVPPTAYRKINKGAPPRVTRN